MYVDVYLWKEWREQRATLAALAVMLLFAAGIVTAIVPARFLYEPILVTWVIGMTVLATLLTVGSDLLPRERQSGAMRFLERLPNGLGRAFRCKLVFFALVLAGAVVYGGVLAALASLLWTGRLPVGLVDYATIVPPLALLSFALWVFAVSAWIPNSALALPAAALLIACLGWPIWLAVTSDLFQPTVVEASAFLVLASVGALASAWAAFVIGSRHGRSQRSAALVGVAVGAVAFVPSWIWAGARYVELKTAPFTVESGGVGEGAHRAFLTLARRPLRDVFKDTNKRFTAIVVDLDGGGWSFAGDIDASYVTGGPIGFRGLHLIGGFDGAAHTRFQLYDFDSDKSPRLLDGVTGRELPIESQTALPPPEPQPSDFGIEDLTAPRYTIMWAGRGYVLRWRDSEGLRRTVHLDPETGRVVELAALLPELEGALWVNARVRAGRWLLQTEAGWVWVDIDTGSTEPVAALAEDDWLGPLVVEDDRVLVVRDGRVSLLDPETGERSPVRSSGDDHAFIRTVARARAWGPPLRLDEPAIVNVDAREWRGLALLDLSAGTIRRASERTEGFKLIATDGATAIAVDSDLRLVRHDFRTDATEVLFSVDELD